MDKLLARRKKSEVADSGSGALKELIAWGPQGHALRGSSTCTIYDDLLTTFMGSLESVVAIIASDDPAAIEEMCAAMSDLESRLLAVSSGTPDVV
jgi:hypothetical protein